MKTTSYSAFTGVGTALVTPFNFDGTVDYVGLEKLVNYQIENGVSFLVVQGTTGESVTLSIEEKKEVLRQVIKTNAGRLPVVLGIGGNNTAEVVNQLKTADIKGVDGILSVSPYYNKPTQEGIFQHYKVVAAATSLPIILYNVPGRTASNVLPETTLRIAEACPNIVAVKEASGNMEQIMHLIRDRKPGFLVLSGDDAITLPIMACGGDGVISVLSNALPKEFSSVVNDTSSGNLQNARKTHYSMLEFTRLLFVEGNPAGVKEALQYLQVCKNHLRLPLVNVSNNASLSIKNELIKLDKL
ncbi:MAG: 4-hydroxy-tetrahydrodipicolinate synthase [Flavobacteriales bacterium]